MQLGRPWTDARMAEDRIRIETPRGAFHADSAICGPGIRQDVRLRPELASFADKIALWCHRYTPPPGEEDPLLAAFPYLGPDYAFLERNAGEAPWLADIHLFGIGSTLSFGPSGSSSNAMTVAGPHGAAGRTRGPVRRGLQRPWHAREGHTLQAAGMGRR